MSGWRQWIRRFRPTRREQLVGATVMAAVIVFGGLILDVPSARRVKALEAERMVLDAAIGDLTGDLARLGVERREAEAEAERLGVGPTADHRFSSLMRGLTGIEREDNVQMVAVRPVPSPAGTAVAIEVNAPLRVLGAYLDELESSPWALTITDIHLMRNPNMGPSVAARLTIQTSQVVSGLAAAPAEKAVR